MTDDERLVEVMARAARRASADLQPSLLPAPEPDDEDEYVQARLAYWREVMRAVIAATNASGIALVVPMTADERLVEVVAMALHRHRVPYPWEEDTPSNREDYLRDAVAVITAINTSLAEKAEKRK